MDSSNDLGHGLNSSVTSSLQVDILKPYQIILFPLRTQEDVLVWFVMWMMVIISELIHLALQLSRSFYLLSCILKILKAKIFPRT